jgi:hypothetical protein
MQTIQMQGTVGEDGKLRLEVPCQLPPGPAEVVVVVQTNDVSQRKRSLTASLGAAKGLWTDEDAQNYVDRLRDE